MKKTLLLLFCIAFALTIGAQSTQTANDRTFFDLKGNVRSVTGYVSDYYNPCAERPLTFNQQGKLTKIDDNPASYYEIKRDKQGRIIQLTDVQGDGSIYAKYTYNEKSKIVREDYFWMNDDTGETGKTGTATLTYDAKGNLSVRKIKLVEGGSIETWAYTYVSFDSKGNWTKRIKRVNGGAPDTETRNIMYFAPSGKDIPTFRIKSTTGKKR